MVPIFQCSPKYRRRISACCSGVLIRLPPRRTPRSPRQEHDPSARPTADHLSERGARAQRRRSRRARGRSGRLVGGAARSWSSRRRPLLPLDARAPSWHKGTDCLGPMAPEVVTKERFGLCEASAPVRRGNQPREVLKKTSRDPSRIPRFYATADTRHSGRRGRQAGEGFEVRCLKEGSSLIYPNVANLRANARISLSGASAQLKGAKVEIRTGSATGKLLGTRNFLDTEDWSSLC
jgi:hypothetical protein